MYIIRGISFVDIYHLYNVYKPTIEIKNIKIEGIFEKLKKFCEMNKDEYKNEKCSDENNINYMDDNKLFSLYVLLANSENVKNFIDKLKYKEFNIKLFIGYGVFLGIIRRAHLYFIYEKDLNNINNNNINNYDILSLMDGEHCEDQICIEKGISLDTLFNIYKEYEDRCYYCYSMIKN